MTKSLGLWKSKKHYICQTPGMSLWMGMQTLQWRALQPRRYKELELNYSGIKFKEMIPVIEGKIRTKDIQDFPLNLNPDCRCRDCRYFRIFRRKEGMND